MAQINQHKVVASLPDPLEANSIYYVRVGEGFDIHVTNSSGVIVAYEQNVYLPDAAEVEVSDAGNYFVSNDVEGVLQEVGSSLEGKVDVVAGKQLSDQNYTLAEKNKLSILENYDDTDVLLSLNNKVDKVSGKQLSTEDFTSALKDKLTGLEGTHWRGTFVSLAALQAGVTDPAAGDYADVDVVGDDAVRYIWDDTDGIWVAQSGAVAPITASQVKLLYESNPDTNAFTDADEAKLGDVQPWATAPTQDAARQNLGLGTAATKNVGTGVGNVMEVGAFGLGSSGRPPVLLDIDDLNSTRIFRYKDSSVGFPTGYGSGLYLHGSDEGSGYANILLTDYSASKYYIMRKFAGVWFTDELIHTGNILTSTGNSTTYPMTQKAVTDALDLKLNANANAVSATKLATARTINGESFDGTEDITIPVGITADEWYLGTDKQQTVAAATGATDLNLANASTFDLTLTGNVTLSVSNATVPAGYTRSIVVRVRQGATERTVTWWGGITWLAPSTPAAPGADKTKEFVLSYDGTSWLGREGASN